MIVYLPGVIVPEEGEGTEGRYLSQVKILSILKRGFYDFFKVPFDPIRPFFLSFFLPLLVRRSASPVEKLDTIGTL